MMGTRILFLLRTAWRSRALLVPTAVVQTITMAMICALAGLVTALLNGGQPTGPLTVFLAVTVVGLLAVSLSMFGVVRAGLQRTLATLELMGSTRLSGRLVLGGVGFLTGAVGVLGGATIALPVHGGLVWLLRSTDYHGLPTHAPSWPTAFALAAVCTLVLAAVSGAAARDARPAKAGRRSGARRWIRPVLGTLLGIGALAALRVQGIAGLGAGTGLGLVAAVVLAGPVLLGLAWLAGRLPLRTMVWPVGFAGRAQHARRATAAASIGVLAVCLFTGITALAASNEQLSRAEIADAFPDDALVATRPGGEPFEAAEADEVCRDAGAACAGVVWISGPTIWPVRDAVTTPAAATALLRAPLDGGRQTFGSDVSGPWPGIVLGPRPAGDWQGLLILTHHPASSIAAQVAPARQWVQTASSEVIILGSGAADIGPMLLPLLLLAALFCAASAYTTHATQGRNITTLDRAGAHPATTIIWCATEAAITTATIFGLGAALWWAITGAADRLAGAHGLTGYLGPRLTPALPAAAIAMMVLLTLLSSTASRQGRNLSL